MLSKKIAQNFALALNRFEHVADQDWLPLAEAEVEVVSEHSVNHACLRCMHACITLEAWTTSVNKQERKNVQALHRGCDRNARMHTAKDEITIDLGKGGEFFFCPWESREDETGGADE